jgi:hypothetical protein
MWCTFYNKYKWLFVPTKKYIEFSIYNKWYVGHPCTVNIIYGNFQDSYSIKNANVCKSGNMQITKREIWKSQDEYKPHAWWCICHKYRQSNEICPELSTDHMIYAVTSITCHTSMLLHTTTASPPLYTSVHISAEYRGLAFLVPSTNINNQSLVHS